MPRTAVRPVRDRELLSRRLVELSESFDLDTITPDPLEVVREFSDPPDQEVVGMIAAAFAYGRADIVVRNVRGILSAMNSSPYDYLRHFDRAEAQGQFVGFSHRFHKCDDLLALLDAMAAAIEAHGSIGELFRSTYDPSEDDIGPSLCRFTSTLVGLVPSAPQSLPYLLSSPNAGSACKRMNLYLRWMVRRESPDLGLWSFVDPAKLIMPLDTHVHRITTFLGLNSRKSADWKTAVALTHEFRSIDPEDPVRFDFALCRLGILDRCSRRRDPEQCRVCVLRDVCQIRID